MNYEELLEKAKEIYESEDTPHFFKAWLLANIIGPANESEDEQSRKWILEYLYDGLRKSDEQFKGQFKTAIAWLEKQQGKSALEAWRDIRFEVYQQASGNRHEPNYSDDTTKMFSLNDFDEIIEKISEQSHNDKVEPKFHVGDWISGNYKVLSVNNDGYKVEDTDGNKINILFENEKFHHLFTIADAKDGDIVYYECHGTKHLFIVKSVGETKDHVEGHFWYDITRNECEIWDGGLPYSNIASMYDAIPATKEQRDLLFQKMKEAGYKWDSENKELKKIEPKKLDAVKVIAWLVANIIDFEYYVRLFKKDFEL